MNAAIERALAELRAIPTREAAPEASATAEPSCCTGDRRGYQWHQRTGNLPACEPSLAAATAYQREYQREWRRRNPEYHRRWRAQQATGGRS